jgi:hypothetical protein
MTAQASLSGIPRATTSTASRGALESDLRGETCLAVLAFLTWAQFHGGATPLLDGTVDRWLCAGRPYDPQIARALTNTRRALARYLEHAGHSPEWVPTSLLEAINESPET